MAVALDRALMFDRERQVAESLQRQLLPQTLPSRDDAAFAARYLPASADIKVGGDWYDAIELDDGGFLFAVGDVMGHGVASASAMGQLRVGLRALATVDPSPAAVLTAADRLAEDLLADRYATACVGRVLPPRAAAEPGSAQARTSAAAEPGSAQARTSAAAQPGSPDGTRVVRLASAGHQPVLHVGPDGDTRWLEVETSVPVGVARRVGINDEVTEHTFHVEAGSTILAFTDGLVERPGEDLDVGHARLQAAASRIFVGDGDLDGRCDALIAAVVDDDPRDDDIALMAIRLR